MSYRYDILLLLLHFFSLMPFCLTIELLEEHFARHSRGQKSTKVIVFTQLRATVKEIVTDLVGTKGQWKDDSYNSTLRGGRRFDANLARNLYLFASTL